MRKSDVTFRPADGDGREKFVPGGDLHTPDTRLVFDLTGANPGHLPPRFHLLNELLS